MKVYTGMEQAESLVV